MSLAIGAGVFHVFKDQKMPSTNIQINLDTASTQTPRVYSVSATAKYGPDRMLPNANILRGAENYLEQFLIVETVFGE